MNQADCNNTCERFDKVTTPPAPPATQTFQAFEVGSIRLELADAIDRYAEWPMPTVIMVDGPYGVGGFPGDPPTVDDLPAWYAPHIAKWSERALPETTLWFWGTELSWATVHPLLHTHGWDYRSAHHWDKGKGHIAGNVNGQTIRRFPVVTEVCVQYTRRIELETVDKDGLPLRLSMKDWVRHEWARSGLPFSLTNQAAGVKNAATRKWFTADHLWYYPPPNFLERIAAFANTHGKPSVRPYFSLDGLTPLLASEWSRLRAKFNYVHGVTNVWSEPPMHGTERFKTGMKSSHLSQKPLKLIERAILASSDEGDVVWDPFAGLATTAVACLRTNRRCYSAEIVPGYFELAKARVEAESIVGWDADRGDEAG
jgi:hypothetical protein